MTPEFSRRILAHEVPARGRHFEIEASADERVALAGRFGILAVRDLRAHGRLVLASGGVILLEAALAAEVEQACVVTLVPVPQRIEEHFSMTFSAAAEHAEEGDVDLFLDQEDPPDLLVDGAVDLGEAVAEHLALALDPFPRAPGAAFEPPPDAAGQAGNPFAVLAHLQKNDD